MPRVSEFFETKNTKGALGIEIEVEGSNLPPDSSLQPYWHGTHDGSLRGECREYVFNKPLSLKDTAAALQHMQTVFTVNRTTINPSIRCGVHVHVNVNDLTINQLFAFAAAYYVFEELITRWCGTGRQGNLFALRAIDAYSVVDSLHSFFQTRRHAFLSTDEIRYAACNYCSLKKFGSLEFRQLGTPADLSRVYRWAYLLDTLKANSIKYFERPGNVVMDVSGYGYDEFVRRLLPEDLANEFVFCHSDYAECMRRGMRLVQDWAFECPPEDSFTVRTRKSILTDFVPVPQAVEVVGLEEEDEDTDYIYSDDEEENQ